MVVNYHTPSPIPYHLEQGHNWSQDQIWFSVWVHFCAFWALHSDDDDEVDDDDDDDDDDEQEDVDDDDVTNDEGGLD